MEEEEEAERGGREEAQREGLGREGLWLVLVGKWHAWPLVRGGKINDG